MMNQVKDPTEDMAEALAGGKHQTILEHLNELRIRVTYAAIAVLITTVISFLFACFRVQVGNARRSVGYLLLLRYDF